MYIFLQPQPTALMVIFIGNFFEHVLWTNTRDFETLFLTIFAISETEQMVVE